MRRSACATRHVTSDGPPTGASVARTRGLLAAGVLLLVWCVTSIAQEVTAPALKAAFVYQLPKFIEWPSGAIAAGAPFSLCTLGDASMADAFERIVKGRDYGGHPIALSKLTAGAPVVNCHVLYVAQGTPRADAIIAEVRERAVLTVSDMDGFLKLGGVIQMHFDGSKLRMQIDQAAANRAKLKISSRLLQLSTVP